MGKITLEMDVVIELVPEAIKLAGKLPRKKKKQLKKKVIKRIYELVCWAEYTLYNKETFFETIYSDE